MNNVAKLETNVVIFLGSDEQRHDAGNERHNVGNECRNVVVFFSYGKLVKISPLGLLISSKLFLLHNNHP